MLLYTTTTTAINIISIIIVSISGEFIIMYVDFLSQRLFNII